MATTARVVTGTLPTDNLASTSFTSSGFGDPQAAIVVATQAHVSANPEPLTCLSIGFWTSAAQRGVAMSTADASANTDTRQRLLTDAVVSALSASGNRRYAASATTDGVSIQNLDTTSAFQRYASTLLLKGLANVSCGHVSLGTGTSAINVTAPGFRADMVLLLTIGASATDTTGSTNGQVCFGAATIDAADTVQQACTLITETDNVAQGDAYTIVRNDCAIADYGGRSEEWKATVGPHASGFTITPSVNASSAVVAYLALEFDDPDDGYVGIHDIPTGTGSQAYTGTGFTPQALILAQTMCTAVNTGTDAGAMAVGMAGNASSGIAQRSLGICSEYNSATTDTESYAATTSALYLKTDAGADEAAATLSTFDSDGWTLNFSDGAASTRKMLSIAFGDSTAGGADTTPPTITGPGGATGATSSISVAENQTAVHTFTANESVTWDLNGGADVALFAINSSTGALTFISAPNYESPADADTNNTYVVGVRATDAAANATTQTVTVTVTDVDEVAPTLSAPSFTATGSSTGTAGVTTNEANGTLYCVVTTSATPPTKAQVKAGNDDGGYPAPYASSQAITTTGAKTFSATGLLPSTGYFPHFMHEDAAGNQSDVSTDATGDTTDAATVTLGVSVRLYNGADDRESLTGLTVCWWDSTTPHTFGAPTFATNTATTDSLGNLVVDLDAVTALDVGDYGCLLVYKVDGTDVRDSLAFFGQVQISNISA